jgi:hypothetical protein
MRNPQTRVTGASLLRAGPGRGLRKKTMVSPANPASASSRSADRPGRPTDTRSVLGPTGRASSVGHVRRDRRAQVMDNGWGRLRIALSWVSVKLNREKGLPRLAIPPMGPR